MTNIMDEMDQYQDDLDEAAAIGFSDSDEEEEKKEVLPK